MNNIVMAAKKRKEAEIALKEAKHSFINSVVEVVAENPQGIYARDIVSMTDNEVAIQSVVGALTTGSCDNRIVAKGTVRKTKFVKLNDDGTVDMNNSIVVKDRVYKYYTPDNAPTQNYYF
jgi:hypothetical protein